MAHRPNVYAAASAGIETGLDRAAEMGVVKDAGGETFLEQIPLRLSL